MKQIILVAAIILVTIGILLGAYLPWVKASSFVSALRNLSNIHSIDQFKENFDEPLNFYSPVGDEEVVKFLSNDILQLINQKGQPEAVSRALAEFIEPRFLQDNPRHLLTAADMYFIFWSKFHNESDYLKSEQYFLKALKIGPRLPPVLYGLLDLYRSKDDRAKMREVAKIIVGYWPNDEKISALLK